MDISTPADDTAGDQALAQLLEDVHRIADGLGRIADLVITVATHVPPAIDPRAGGA